MAISLYDTSLLLAEKVKLNRQPYHKLKDNSLRILMLRQTDSLGKNDFIARSFSAATAVDKCNRGS